MRVLVLGGTGLISTAIVHRLVEENHTPILFNRGQNPKRYGLELESIVGDRQDFDDFEAKVSDLSVDAVIDMITFGKATADANLKVFRGKVAHYLFCSTVCVYGGPLSALPATEEESRTPVSDYGRGKVDAEIVFEQAYANQGFPVTTFRPSHCYGPGQPLLDIWGYNPCLVNRIREGRPIIVPGDGYGQWQPGHVSDMAKGFVGALGRTGTHGQAYNIVGDEIMNWRTFHERMAQALGCSANIVCMTTPQIMAGAPADQSGMLHEIFQYPGAFTNAALKEDVPEFTDLIPWQDGVRDTVAWMDEKNIHQDCDTQPWIDALAQQAANFEERLRKEKNA
jgi:nucleoside-diphosphate-sugar epimerase